MNKGDEVTIQTTKEKVIVGTVRVVFSTFLIVDDDYKRPAVILKSDIDTFSLNS